MAFEVLQTSRKQANGSFFSKVLYTRQRTELPPRLFSKRFCHCGKTMLEKEANKNGIKDDISIAVFHAVVLDPSDLAHAEFLTCLRQVC
jgi:hypothetical protein